MPLVQGLQQGLRSGGLRQGLNGLFSVTSDITLTVIDSGRHGADADGPTSFLTTSLTPAANTVHYLAVMSGLASGAATQPTCTGQGLTWTVVETETISPRRMTVFRACGAAPTAGQLTVDFAGQVQTSWQWYLISAAGADTSGSDGAGSVVQATSTSSAAQGTTWASTLSAFGNPKNRHLCFAAQASSAAFTKDASFTACGTLTGETTVALNMIGQEAANIVTCTSTVANVAVFAISIEVKARVS